MATAQAGVPPQRSRLARTAKALATYRTMYLMLLPGICSFLLFDYGPLYGLQLAFKKFMFNKGITGSPWVGFDNFAYLFEDPKFWTAFQNTLIISFGKLLIVFPVPIVLALLLNELRGLKFKRVIQTILYIPHFFSWVIIAGIFFSLFSSTVGLVSRLALELFDFKMPSIIVDPDYFLGIIFSTSIWHSAGWGTIVYLAAIAGINPEMYESAVIDGASRWQQVLHITLPAIRFAVAILLILEMGHVMNAGFDQIFNFYSPPTYEVGDIIDTYVYRLGILGTDYGLSTAVGLFKSVVNCALLLAVNGIAKRLGEEGVF